MSGYLDESFDRGAVLCQVIFFLYYFFFRFKFSVLYLEHIYFWQPDTNVIDYSYPLDLPLCLGINTKHS